MAHDVKIWCTENGKWRASVDWQGERLFGEADTPALAIVQLGYYWEDRARHQDSDIQTLAKVVIAAKERD
jgi:hypothetical protein